MPWPPKQRTAIFLNVQRRHGTAAAERVMAEAGYAKKRKRKRHPGLARAALNR